MKKTNNTSTRKARPKASKSKAYWDMNAAELADATKEFDQEFVGETFRTAKRQEQARFDRARKRGRPQVGEGSKTISVTVEAGLLAKTDRLAKKLQVPRAVLIARGLQAVVGQEVTM